MCWHGHTVGALAMTGCIQAHFMQRGFIKCQSLTTLIEAIMHGVRSHAAAMLAITGAQLLLMILVVHAIHIVLYFDNRIES